MDAHFRCFQTLLKGNGALDTASTGEDETYLQL